MKIKRLSDYKDDSLVFFVKKMCQDLKGHL